MPNQKGAPRHLPLRRAGFYESVHTYRHTNPPGAGFPPIFLSLPSIINADYTAATVLISFGALLGRVSAAQMLVMTFVEVRIGGCCVCVCVCVCGGGG